MFRRKLWCGRTIKARSGSRTIRPNTWGAISIPATDSRCLPTCVRPLSGHLASSVTKEPNKAHVGVLSEHVPRATDAPERDHRLLRGVDGPHVRRPEREAGGISQGHL